MNYFQDFDDYINETKTEADITIDDYKDFMYGFANQAGKLIIEKLLFILLSRLINLILTLQMTVFLS